MNHFSGLELRKISVNTFIQFLVRIIGSITTLITTLLLTYFLGLSTVGSFTKVVTFVGIFYLLLDFGLNSVVIKHYYKSVEEQIGNLVVLRLLIAVILIPLILILSYLLPSNEIAGTGFSQIEKGAIAIYSLTLIALAVNNSLQALLQRKLSYSLLVMPSFVSNVFLILIVLYAVYIGNFYLLVTAYIFSGTILALLSYLKVKQHYSTDLKLSNFLKFSRNLLSSSWPLGLMLLINLLYVRADVIILSFLKPSTDVGIYGISYRFFEVALSLPAFLANSTYPLLIEVSKNHKKYIFQFTKYLKLYTVLSLIAMVGILLCAPLLKILGVRFYGSVLPLQILSIALPFFFATSLLQWHFLIKGKMKLLVPLYLVSLILNVFLNIHFVPRFSYIASAWITVMSEGLVFFVMLWYFYRGKNA